MYLNVLMSLVFHQKIKLAKISTCTFLVLVHSNLFSFPDGLVPTHPISGKIEFRDIHFAYPSRQDALIFSNLNLSVNQGSVLAVVGPSGSGKSTLAALLLRMYDTNQGETRAYLCIF